MGEIEKKDDEVGIIHLDLKVTGEDEKEDQASVLEALTSNEFKYIITEYLFSHLVEAIEKNKKSFVAFRLPQQEQDYVLEKTQYKKVLQTILSFTEQEEDYDKCAAIKKLIDTI